MAAVIKKRFRSLLAVVNLNQGGSSWMGLAEVSTKSTLACMQCDHKRLLFQIGCHHTLLHSTGNSSTRLFGVHCTYRPLSKNNQLDSLCRQLGCDLSRLLTLINRR